jgi:heme/copper-type cytochrome/quinol oxidase subunit 1
MLYGGFFAIVRGLMSWYLRIEILMSNNNFLFNNHMFNVLTTTHALVIIFFFLMPALISGFRNMLTPLYTGVPDIAFPRMNNLSYWLLFPAAIMILTSAIIEGGVGTGWTLYPPLAALGGHGGGSVDCAILTLHMAGASSIMGGINFITTIMTFGMGNYEQIALFN